MCIRDRECIDAGVPCFTIEPWDWRFYAEKLRKETYGFDAEDLRPYLQLQLMQEAMFWVARELFDLRFVEVPAGSVPLNHPDVKVFEVQQADGSHVGLWYFDAVSYTHLSCSPINRGGFAMNRYFVLLNRAIAS